MAMFPATGFRTRGCPPAPLPPAAAEAPPRLWREEAACCRSTAGSKDSSISSRAAVDTRQRLRHVDTFSNYGLVLRLCLSLFWLLITFGTRIFVWQQIPTPPSALSSLLLRPIHSALLLLRWAMQAAPPPQCCSAVPVLWAGRGRDVRILKKVIILLFNFSKIKKKEIIINLQVPSFLKVRGRKAEGF